MHLDDLVKALWRTVERRAELPQHRLLATLPRMTAALQADPVGWYKQHKLALSSALKTATAAQA